ncbi:MAG: hypothetical protein ABIP89_05030 [Polyangiaceae bacterium]
MTGPFVHVVGINVDATHKATTNGVIQIAFDRMLLPITVTRQSILLLDYTTTAIAPVVSYDPVARVVTLSNPNPGNPSWLKADQAYKIVLGIPEGDVDVGGVRAIDRAPLDPSQVLQFGFLVSADSTPQVSNLVSGPPMNFCNDIFPIFTASCSQGTCHGPVAGKVRPAAGLVLGTSAGVANTAIARVANGSNTGPLAGPGHAPSHIFGIDMPLIDPGNPGNSWLLYKVLLGPPSAPVVVDTGTDAGADAGAEGGAPVATCTPGAPFPAASFDVTAVSDDERARLSNYVLGNKMPYPAMPGTNDSSGDLTLDQMERLRAWIQQGAIVTDCSACPQ